MHLIVGLGNPGREYRQTRHNVGFMLLDRLALKMGARFTRLQSHSLIASAVYSERRLILAKPQTFMNLSGRAVQGLVHFYKLPLTNLIVAQRAYEMNSKVVTTADQMLSTAVNTKS